MLRDKIRTLFKQLFSFGSIGAIIAVFSISIYYVTFSIFNLPVYPIYTIVYCIAVYVSYFLNSRYTFEEKRNTKAMRKYYLVYGVGLIVGLGLIAFGKQVTNWSDFIVTIASIIPRTILVFIFSKLFVFGK